MLRAGPLTATLENGDLRYIRLGDTEIVRRLYVAIRDRNWGTIPPNYTTFRVQDHGDHFRVDLVAEHVSGDVDFAWSGTIKGSADGTIRYSLEGAPRKPFFRNRIGFCVLHPSDLAGAPARTETPNGPVEGAFPDLISPHQPFFDMLSITHAAGEGAEAAIRFEGDLFEMEDQRNWTDASYKTYSTPLRIPYPVEVDPSTRIAQSVTIAVSGTLPETEPADQLSVQTVTVDFSNAKPLPTIGFGAGRKGTITPEDMSRFRALKPAHLWVSLDLGSDAWRDRLHEATDRATALITTLDLSVVAAPGKTGWDTLVQAIQDSGSPVGRVFAFPPASEPVTFPRTDLATHPETVDAARRAFQAIGSDAVIGGGARSYFTELNRAMEFLPVDDLDVATYPLNPQVHASDNLSIIETLMAQGDTVRSAKQLVPGTPLVVGPVTLAPPFNPNATGPAPETPEGELPAAVDPRQLSLLGAGWTLGSIHRLADAGVDGMTFYELYGWRGLSERRQDLSERAIFPSEPGQLFPLYHIFAAASDFAGGSVAAVTISDPLQVEALALRKDDQARILVASFADESIDISLDIPSLSDATIRYLDESTYANAMDDPDFVRNGKDPLSMEGSKTTIHLFPFAIACITGVIV
jgi:hypothetical protein